MLIHIEGNGIEAFWIYPILAFGIYFACFEIF